MSKGKEILDEQENDRISFSSSKNSELTNSQLPWAIQRFQKMVRRHPDHTSVIYFGDDLENKEKKPLRLTYHQLDQLSNHLAKELISKCPPNAVVAVILANMHEYLIALLAIWKAGLVFLPLEIVPDEVKNKGKCHLDSLICRIEQAQAKALVIHSDYKSYFSKEILMLEWQALFNHHAPSIFQSFTSILRNLNDPAYIYCSSGTTQAPKMILNDFSGLPGRVRDVASMMKLKYTCVFYNPTEEEIRYHPYTLFFFQEQEQWYYSVTDVYHENIIKQLLPQKLKELISREDKDYNEAEEDEILDTLFFETKEFKNLTPPALLGYCGPAFDASLLDFLMIICYGGCLYPVTQQQRQVPGIIPEIFKKAKEEKHAISAAVLMPKPLEIIYEKEKSLAAFQSLTAMITMGEKCDPRILSSWFQGIQHLDIYNGYGPTETTIATTVTQINKTKFIKNDPADNLSEELYMHHPLKGVKLYYMEYKTEGARNIFNESEIKALKQDLEVEIIIGGAGVGQYIAPIEGKVEAEQVFRNQSDAHFLTYNDERNLHTFKEKDEQTIEIKNLPHSDPQRYYRTGDLAILKSDGRLLFKSRVDNCLKKNGRLILLDPIAEKMQKWPFVNKVILIGVRDHIAAFFIPTRETDEESFCRQLFAALNKPLEFERPSFYFLVSKEEKINSLKSMTLKDLSELTPKPKLLIHKDTELEKLGELAKKIAEIWADIIFSDIINDEKFSNILPSAAFADFFTPQSDFWCSGGDSLSCSRMLNQVSTKLINQHGISSQDFRSEFIENPKIENLTNLVRVCNSITIKHHHERASVKPIFVLETTQSEMKDEEFISTISLKKYDQYWFIKININYHKINKNDISTQEFICKILLKKFFSFQNEGLFCLFVPSDSDSKLLERIKEKFSQLSSKKLKILDDLSHLGKKPSDHPGRSIKEIKKEFEGHLEVLQDGKSQCCIILCYPLTGDCSDQYYQLMASDCFSAEDMVIALMMNRKKIEAEQKLNTISKKSAYYVNILQSLVPQPEVYIIVGWSFGALVMTQLALDLEKRQKKISLLVNIDCPSPSYIVQIPPLNRAKGLTSALSERPRLTVPFNLITLDENEQKSKDRQVFCPQCDINSFASVQQYYRQIYRLTEVRFQDSLKEFLPSMLVKEQTIFESIFGYLYEKNDFNRLCSIFTCSEINWAAYYQFGHHFPLSADKKSNIMFKLAIAQHKTPYLNEDSNFRHWQNYFEKFDCKEFDSNHFNIFENQDFIQWLKNIINENRVLAETTLSSLVLCNPKEYVLDGKLLDEKKIEELKERLEKKTIDSISLRNHDSLADDKIIKILAQALKGATLTALNLIHIGLGYQGITMLTMNFSTSYLKVFAKTPACYLQILNLAGNQLGAKGANIIADRIFPHFKHLTQLNISNNDFGDEGVKNLARGLPKSKLLRQLELTHNNITQEGTVALAKILAKSSLTLLNLNKNNIRDKGIEALTHYLKKSQMTSIYVSNQTETICHHKMTLLNQALEINQQRLAKL